MQVSLKNSLMLEGARVRLKPLMKEVNELRGLLGLDALDEGKGGTRKKGGKANTAEKAVTRNRKPMSAAARKAMSARMKLLWQNKRSTMMKGVKKGAAARAAK